MKKTLDEHIEEMKNAVEHLIPLTFPLCHPSVQSEIDILKYRELMIDGYEVILYFSRADFGDHFEETFQVLGKNCPFLPFNLICKLAKKFLGGHNLTLVEVLKDNRKIYCWTVFIDKSGRPVPNSEVTDAEKRTFEGLYYSYLNPNQVTFF